MANLAILFHWSLPDMKSMPLEELVAFHKLALERAPKHNR
ncbi:GpE family phage tail protein [Endozoicomonas montiporae]|nr:GpE family phage tail protein [Endozoicomonas montiporae]